MRGPRFSAPHIGWLVIAVMLMAGAWGSIALVQLGRRLERNALDDQIRALEVYGAAVMQVSQFKCDALLRRAP